MAKDEDSGTAAQRRLLERQYAKDAEKRKPTVMGSLKEGVKSVGRKAKKLAGLDETNAPAKAFNEYGAKRGKDLEKRLKDAEL